MSSITVRPATPEDSALIMHFVTELAIYEKAEHEVVATAEVIRDSLFNESSGTSALICTLDDVPIGFAVYFYSYSTWLGKKGLYLEDLYVSPEYRGAGAGKALLKYLAKVAIDTHCGRFEWSVLDWNEPAIQFYKSLGAEPQDEWIRYRLTGRALEALASN